MNKIILIIAVVFGLSESMAQSVNKKSVIDDIEKNKSKLIEASDKIWAFAETAFEEDKSANVLISLAEKEGFKVEKSVAGVKTAFVATYGSGKPVIGILGEFDALPGISQKAKPTKDPLNAGSPGHGCGHNLFGTGSLGAAIAIKNLMKAGKIKGTIKFFGTPAEEKFFGKLWMLREGVFEGLDVCLDWHPSSSIESDVQSSLALIDFIVEFYGQAAHASGDPWNGRSASDGLELFTTGINYAREHVKPTVRIHYHIQDGGQVVNVVPDYSKIWTRVRDTKRDGMMEVYQRVLEIAEGAAKMAGVEHKVSLVSGIHEYLVNRAGGAILQKNLEYLGTIEYTKEEEEFAKIIQRETGKPQIGMDSKINPLEETQEHPMGGSTDAADVSWNIPTIKMGVTTAPKDTPWHSWAVVACGGMSIGHKGMVYASKALAMTAVDLFENPKAIEAVKKEFKERKGDYKYVPMVPDGPPPLGAAKN